MQSLRLGRLTALLAGSLTVLVVASSVSACSTGAPRQAERQDAPAIKTFAPQYEGKPQLAPPDMTDDGPGSLVSVEPIKGGAELLDEDGATYMRVVYRSTSGIDGTPTEVSAAIAIPAGVPPKGGWPVIGFGQGTKGVLYKCASSLFPNLPKQAWSMDQFIKAGYAVTASDFQGSGVKGYAHPFLDAKTYGYNIIDSVRAARRVGAEISDKWMTYGHSAGGLAVWAAAEEAQEYGKGLNLLGTISMAPAADMSGLADAAWNGTLTNEQRVTMVYALQSIKWFHPEMNLDDFRSGVTAANWDLILNCIPTDFDQVGRVWETMTNADLKPKTYEDVVWLREQLAARAVPSSQRIDTPLVVAYGTQDGLVNQAWFETAISRACAAGSNLEIKKDPGKGHADLDQAFVMGWLNDRLSGVPAPPSNCADWQKTELPK
ncbi:alpha/beta hydrolase [Mycolicibacterium fluoranthenivorans]|jgi:pimeloyl-ACP methyl ester carboxylesterase|uniref:Alpha/beta hydrolase n=1 Tax=Mycolicibacterium fluoranthenivorans TaxID=258505 RepID=A0A1G4VWM8_9MYCO|nr:MULTISPECIES: lipase family protein [Mycobacteriaceae]MCV7252107.1 alpha/beta hydrolase [Mycobacterium hackensackense]QNJ95020.1 alpha/beta hydrolase [Mycolicibacterium fluoranthenivorans]SCX13048.1 Secretory lipase [Mycolicibacterium fluoranthenivorans]